MGGWAAAATAADAAAAAERLFQPPPHSITQWCNHSCHSAANCEASITAAAAAAGVAWASLVEARLGAGNGGLQRQSGGGALLVLRQRGDRGSIGKLADSLQGASAARVVWLLCCNSRRMRWPGWATAEISTTSQPIAGLAVQPASTAAARSIAALAWCRQRHMPSCRACSQLRSVRHIGWGGNRYTLGRATAACPAACQSRLPAAFSPAGTHVLQALVQGLDLQCKQVRVRGQRLLGGQPRGKQPPPSSSVQGGSGGCWEASLL